MATTLKLTNNRHGRSFNVRLVRKGDGYGRDYCLTHDKDDPLVEFYDDKHEGDPRFDPLGQFVSRYYASTLRDRPTPARYDRWSAGLCLHGDEPKWNVEAAEMADVLTWLGEVTP